MTDIENVSSEEKVVDAMKAEAKEAGIPSVFPEDEPAKPAEESAKPEPKEEEKPRPKAEEKPTPQPRVPFRDRIKAEVRGEYEPKLKEKDEEIARLKALKDPESKLINLDEEVKAYIVKHDLNEDQVKELVALSRRGLEDEVKQLKSKFEEKEKSEAQLLGEKQIADQEKAFNDEFSTSIIPAIKAKYPNASVEQLSKAQDAMEELAFTEKYHLIDLDYIFSKEAETFERILFSPKVKGFETTSPPEAEVGDKDADPFGDLKVGSYKDVEKAARKMDEFAESLPDSRFSVK